VNRYPGVWTYEDCALETPAGSVELNVRLLAKTAKACDRMRPM
jgi:hypothetical protein